jgi:hypothetical protein
MFALPTAINTHGPGLSDFLKINKPQLLCENVIVSVTFGEKYLTGMVTSVPPYETFSLIKNNILHQSKKYKNHFENSNFVLRPVPS